MKTVVSSERVMMAMMSITTIDKNICGTGSVRDDASVSGNDAASDSCSAPPRYRCTSRSQGMH